MTIEKDWTIEKNEKIKNKDRKVIENLTNWTDYWIKIGVLKVWKVMKSWGKG